MAKATLMLYLATYKAGNGKEVIMVDTLRIHSDDGIQFDSGRIIIPLFSVDGKNFHEACEKLEEMIEHTDNPLIKFFSRFIHI